MEDAGERAATRLEQTGGKLAEGLIDKEKRLKTGAATIKGSLKVRLARTRAACHTIAPTSARICSTRFI